MTEALCPLCSAGPGQCGHEIGRWSLYAGEWEPASLEKVLQQFCTKISELFRSESAPVLWDVNSSLRWLKESNVLDHWIALDDEDSDICVESVFELVGNLPDVRCQEEGHDQRALVLWAMSPTAVHEQLEEWIRAIEIEVDRKDE